jgi:hypothetical protein
LTLELVPYMEVNRETPSNIMIREQKDALGKWHCWNCNSHGDLIGLHRARESRKKWINLSQACDDLWKLYDEGAFKDIEPYQDPSITLNMRERYNSEEPPQPNSRKPRKPREYKEPEPPPAEVLAEISRQPLELYKPYPIEGRAILCEL